MMLFNSRSKQDEIMDDPSVGFDEFAETLRQLEDINRQTGAYAPSLAAVASFIEKKKLKPGEKFRILDVGCGYGDTLREIYRWAQTKKIPLEMQGLDLSPWSKKAAQKITPKNWDIQFLTGDVFKFRPKPAPHLIINSLFTHHLSDAQIVALMQWMTKTAVDGWFINDLHRHFLPYYFIRYWTRYKKYNRLIVHDAPVSVARAFVRNDWEKYVQAAGLTLGQVQILWQWPFRWGICLRKH